MDEDYDLRVLNLGAGVQSSTAYLMSCVGELPRYDAALFADPGAELPETMEWLDQMEEYGNHIIPIYRCSSGSLEKNIYVGGEGRKGSAQIPTFLEGEEQNSIALRGCSHHYKIKPLQAALRELLGLAKGERAAGKFRCATAIGISADEAHRAKESDISWIDREYPLLYQVDPPMTRSDCKTWLMKHGFPLPPASSCWFCPFHSDAAWISLRDKNPDLFHRAVQMDQDLRGGEILMGKNLRGKQYLHNSCKPLGEVEFKHENQPDLFGNECEGVCGV
jgi:hypothetical protein